MEAGNGREVAEWGSFGSYRVRCQPLGHSDRHLLHELTLGARWPHRERDFDLFLSLGRGYLALDEIGRAVSSAMAFPVGDDLAMLGMMITARRMQAQGIGRWLLDLLLRDQAGRDLRLSATREAFWLYEAAGFVPVAPIWQHQGRAGPAPSLQHTADIEVSPLSAADYGTIHALDAQAYGGPARSC